MGCSMEFMVKLLKKGDVSNCKKWRGIMLLSVTFKVLSRIILTRITEKVEKKQAGFRIGKSCADQIFTIRQVIEQSN